jgi:hypothetical protein
VKDEQRGVAQSVAKSLKVRAVVDCEELSGYVFVAIFLVPVIVSPTILV